MSKRHGNRVVGNSIGGVGIGFGECLAAGRGSTAQGRVIIRSADINRLLRSRLMSADLITKIVIQ